MPSIEELAFEANDAREALTEAQAFMVLAMSQMDVASSILSGITMETDSTRLLVCQGTIRTRRDMIKEVKQDMQVTKETIQDYVNHLLE